MKNLTTIEIDPNAKTISEALGISDERKDEIKKVLDDCTSSDYDHLLATLLDNTTDEIEDYEEEEE